MLAAVGFAWVVAALSSQPSLSSPVGPTQVSVSVRTVASVSVLPTSTPNVGHALSVGAAPGGGSKPAAPKSAVSKPSSGNSGGAAKSAPKPSSPKPAAKAPAAKAPAPKAPAPAAKAPAPKAPAPAAKTPAPKAPAPAAKTPAPKAPAPAAKAPAPKAPAVNGQPVQSGKSTTGIQPADTSTAKTAKTGQSKNPDPPDNQGAVTGHPAADQHAPASGTPVANGQTTPKHPTVGTPQGSPPPPPPPLLGGKSVAPNSVSDTSTSGLRLAPGVGRAWALAGMARQNSDGSYSMLGPGNPPAPLGPGLPAPDHTPPAVPAPSTPGPTNQTRTTTSGSGSPAPTTNPFLAMDNALTMPGADPTKLKALDDAVQGAPQPVPSPNTGPDPPTPGHPTPPLSHTDPYLVNQVHNPSTATNQPHGQPAAGLVAAPTAGTLARVSTAQRVEAGLEGLGETGVGLGEGLTGAGAEVLGLPADGTGVGVPAGAALALGGAALFDFAGHQFVNGWHDLGRAFSSTAPAGPATPKPSAAPTLPSPQVTPGPGTDPAPTGSPQTAPNSPLIPNYDPLHPPNPFDPNNPFNPNATPTHNPGPNTQGTGTPHTAGPPTVGGGEKTRSNRYQDGQLQTWDEQHKTWRPIAQIGGRAPTSGSGGHTPSEGASTPPATGTGPNSQVTGPTSSPLVPGGGLQAHEKNGGVPNAIGHTLKPSKAHVGATDQQMQHRLLTDPNHPSAVSSFHDRATAERAVHDNIIQNQSKINTWLHNTNASQRPFMAHHGFSTGRSVERSDPSHVQDVSGSRVVLQRDASSPLGYQILTSHPVK